MENSKNLQESKPACENEPEGFCDTEKVSESLDFHLENFEGRDEKEGSEKGD